MKQIDVSDDVYRVLGELAEPFVDQPDTVLQRVLEDLGFLDADDSGEHLEMLKNLLNESQGGSSGPTTPGAAYRLPLLQALEELGGSADGKRLLDRTIARMGKTLTSADRELLPSGASTRFESQARTTLAKLQPRYVTRDEAPGEYVLTDEGRQATHDQGAR